MGTPFLDSSTGRYYDVVLSNSITPADALAQAGVLSYRGLTGYLATVTSSGENQTVFNLIKPLPVASQGVFIFGASDAAVDTRWVWQSGPEKGTALSFTNWDARSNEPNNFWGSVREDFIAINSDAGKWVDLGGAPYIGTAGYIVEYGGMPATYAISTPNAKVTEGASVVFSIETTNVEWGKTVAYTISGITAADLSAGTLTGTAVVNQVGNKNIATVSLTLADDKLAEGDETLTLTVGGVSQSVTVADPGPFLDSSTGRYYDVVLSKSITPADALAQAGVLSYRGLTGYLATVTSSGENQTVFNLIKPLPVASQGVFIFGASDAAVDTRWVWESGPEKGTALSFTNWDARSNEPNNFWGSVREDFIAINSDAGKWVDLGGAPYIGTAGYIVEYGGMPATYAISTPNAKVTEGASVVFSIETTNVEWGKTVAYTISGITAADLSAGALTGTAVVNQVGNKNIATVSLTLADDKLAEGDETLTLTVGDVSQSVTVADPGSVTNDSGNTLGQARDLGNLSYDVAALGALKGQEFSETVGGDTDTADFFKFELSQANGMYLNLTSTVGTRFQMQNAAGTPVGTMSLGSSMGMPMGSANYMLNLEPGTYYLRVNTIDSTERAAYTVKTVLAPQDTQSDNLAVTIPMAQKLGSLGINASLKTQAYLWSNYGSGTSSNYNMMSGQNSNDAYSFTLSQDAKVKFDLSALKNASYINASISSSNGTPVGYLNLSTTMPAGGTASGGSDQAIFEKDLLAGTYSILINGMGMSKYDTATGTNAYLPTQYQLTLSASASAMATNDSGNTLGQARDLGNLSYDVAALGALKGQEFSETVGGDTDTADFFKFELSQANGMYLNLTSTVGTRFQMQNAAGTPVGTMSLGSSMGMPMGSANYMLNLEPGTYYLRVNTIDSTERAAYTVKTVLAPQDTQSDNLAVTIPMAQKLGSLGINASLKTQAYLWSNYGSGTSSNYNMMSGQNSNDAYSFTLSQDAKVKFDLSALKNASYINASISSSNGTPVGYLNLSTTMPAGGTASGGSDQAIFEKDLLAGTYSILINGMGMSKYDTATGTNAYLPTQYQLTLSASASAMATNDSGNTLGQARDLGNLGYDVAALGALKGQEFSETVGGDTDTADFFKFELSQANGMYLNLTSTVGTRFQMQNAAGTPVGTMSLGSSMGMPMGSANYMLNLEPGTYYLRVNTIDSTERAAYTVKTVLAPQDTQSDNLAVTIPMAQKLGSLGINASLKTQAYLWSNYGSGTSSNYNMMSGQNSNDAYSFTLSQDAKVKFDLSALKNASYINASISSSNGTPVGYLNLSTTMPAGGTASGGSDQAIFEKDLLAGTYSILINGMGMSKYDTATGTNAYLPTQYQLTLSTGTGGGADTTAPALSITSDKAFVQVGDTAVLSFAFSEKPVGFDLNDIKVSNGTVSDLRVSANDASLYTANFTPASTAAHGDAITVNIAPGSYQDAAGNLGGAFTLSTMKVVVPVYNVVATDNTVDEGGSLTFSLNTQNLSPGTVVPYTLSGTGISSGDIDGGLLSGTFKTDATGAANLAVRLLADRLTEGNEVLVFTAAGKSASVTVRDTSTSATVATPGVVFTEATNLKTTEAGGRAQFKVALASAPRHDVTLTLTSNDPGEGLLVSSANAGTQILSASQVLAFTPTNWNQAQTVSLVGVDDGDTDGNVAYVISGKIASTDLNYDGMRAGQGIVVPNLIVENADDDNPDEALGTPGNDVLYGGPGPSDVYGFLGRDEMYGGKGDDRLYGGYGDDVLYGEDGNDSLEGEQGSDKLYGGSGRDSLTGGSGNDSLFGGDGDDVLDGQDGADFMDGGKGADTYYVDNPADVVTDSGADGALDTVYIASYLGSTYVMGRGIVNGTLSAQAGPGGLSGNASDNKLEGNNQNNTLSGGLGSDTIAGGGGNDSVDGGEGTDTVVLTGKELDYSITTDANKLLTYLTSKTSGEVTTVSSVEFLQFKDTLKSLLSTVKGDTTAPTMANRAPAANASNVNVGSNLTLTFSEPVQAGSGSIAIKAGASTRSINVTDATQVIFAGNTMVVNPAEDLAAGTLYTVEIASGVVQDLSGNAYAGLSGYSFTTQAAASTTPVANQFVGLSNVRLVKDVAGSKSTVSFSITLSGASIEGQKINGMLLDLDYDHSKVSAARVSGVQYDSEGANTPVWQFITPNLQGATANGKIVSLTNSDPANPVLVGGKTLDVTLTLNQALDSFKIGFNKQSANLYTADGQDRLVATSADVTAVPNTSYMLKASTVHWKNLAGGTAKALPDVSFVKGSQTLKSSSAGQAVFEASTDSQASVTVGKSVTESEKAAAAAAVNLTDAIAILKMIVGLPVNATGTATSPYQVVAADYNRDGNVALTDAIDVLKSVVGLNAPAPGWVILDQSKVTSSTTMDSYNADKTKTTGWMSSNLSVDLDKTPEIQLVGVLAGDVDGSWAG